MEGTREYYAKNLRRKETTIPIIPIDEPPRKDLQGDVKKRNKQPLLQLSM